MSVKIIRRKRLFEDDTTNTTTAQSTAPAASSQPAPATTLQPSASTNNQPNTLLTDTNTQQLQQTNQLEQSQPNEILQKVLELLELMKNTYWCIANNIPEMIKEKLPDFKPDNASAKPIIDLWDAFKKDPNENTFNAFINTFATFGTEQNQQASQQPALQQQNINAGIIYNFRKSLSENLAKTLHQQKVENTFKTYY